MFSSGLAGKLATFCSKWKSEAKGTICKEWTAVGWEWEEIQDVILCEIKPGEASAAVAAPFSFPRKLEPLDVTAGNVGGAGQSSGGGGDGENNNERRKHAEQLCGFF